jgi:hypothetical protein
VRIEEFEKIRDTLNDEERKNKLEEEEKIR